MGDLRLHLMRVRRMAQLVGADPAAAREAGTLDHAQWADMVARCRGCPAPKTCARWLERSDTSRKAMPGCLNARLLTALRDDGQDG